MSHQVESLIRLGQTLTHMSTQPLTWESGEHNHCRNPDQDPEGVWCYTTDSDKRREHCSVPICSTSETPQSPHGVGMYWLILVLSEHFLWLSAHLKNGFDKCEILFLSVCPFGRWSSDAVAIRGPIKVHCYNNYPQTQETSYSLWLPPNHPHTTMMTTGLEQPTVLTEPQTLI